MSDASPVLLTPDVVGGLAGKRVLVVGDIMLDAYLIGDADRISPEAPVPVVRIEKERYLLGGAGNVARNIVALGGVATLAGVMGKDASADRIRGLVRDEGICGAFVALPQRPTTVKTRVMARRQQMLRLDSEDASPLSSADQEALLSVIIVCSPIQTNRNQPDIRILNFFRCPAHLLLHCVIRELKIA